MLTTRQAALGAGETGKSSPALAIVYLILIGQLLAILIMYYKRAFMIAFLITIFPLVGMTYVLDRLGDGKNQTFGIWFKEFVVNVIVQLFHGLVYVLITGSAVQAYINQGGGNFIFLVICVWFLFEGEKILRSIFNIKSKAGTVSDLATAGALVVGSATKMGGLLKKNPQNYGSAQDKADASAAKASVSEKTKSQQDNEAAAAKAMEESGGAASLGEYQGKDNEPGGIKPKSFDSENAKNQLLAKAMKVRLNGGFAGKAVNLASGVVGGTLGAAQQMAMGKISPADIIAGAAGGKALGQELASPVKAVAGKIDQAYAGHKEAEKVRSGEYDRELGIGNIGGSVGSTPPGTLGGSIPASAADLEEVLRNADLDKYKPDVQAIYREALARYVGRASTGGRASAEKAFWDYVEEETRSR